MNTIIAEAGSNHNGNKENAKKLIELAYAAGASSIKFQFIFPEGLYLPYTQVDGKMEKSVVFDIRKKEQLTRAAWEEVWLHAKTVGIPISASVFCSQGVSLLKHLGAEYVKIASTDLTNISLINLACQNFNDVIISTGMATIEEIANTVAWVRQNYPNLNLKLMHCVSVYPCDFKQSQLNRISALSKAFDLDVGYSDHTSDATSAAMAWSMGVRIFEKHFTHDKSASGFDHAHAQDAEELHNYVDTLNSCNQAVIWQPNEIDAAQKITKVRARRGFYAARDLPKGHILTESDILSVRPSSNLGLSDASQLIGRRLETAVQKYTAFGQAIYLRQEQANWKEAQSFWLDEMKQKRME